MRHNKNIICPYCKEILTRYKKIKTNIKKNTRRENNARVDNKRGYKMTETKKRRQGQRGATPKPICPKCGEYMLSLIHISEPTRLLSISYAVFCLKKKKHTTRTSRRPFSSSAVHASLHNKTLTR